MRRVLSFCIAVGLVFTTVSMAKADQLNDNKQKLSDVQNSINNNKQKVNDISKTQGNVQSQIDALDANMNKVSKSLGTLNIQIGNLSSKIDSSQQEIDKLQKDLNSENIAFRARLRALYMAGDEAYFDVILGSKSFSDIISRIEDIKKIMDYDRNLLLSISNNKKMIENKKKEMIKSKASVESLKVKANDDYKQLADASSQKKAMMESLENDKSNYEKEIAEEQAQSENIGAMIRQIEKAQADAKKKAAEDAAKAAQNGSGGSKNGSTQTGGGSQSSGSTISNGKLFCVTGRPYSVTSPYGWRVQPVTGKKEFHPGMDLGVPLGTPIYALTDGKVIYSGQMSGYGNVVMIDHGNIISLYAHNSSLVVSVGQSVKGGQLISYSGNTGLSTGPHMHFELRDPSTGNTIDPTPYYIR